MPDAITDTLAAAVQRLRALKDRKDELEKELKEVNKEARELQEHTIPKMMEDGELEKARVGGAGSVYIKQELYVSMTPAEDGFDPPFYDWALENAPDIIKPYIHPSRLKAWCKERLEQGQAIPDIMLKATFVPTAILLRR